MYKGKYQNKPKKKYMRVSTVLVCLVLLASVSIGGTLAFMKVNTTSISNSFKSAEISTEIVETLNNGTKSKVMVKNTGSTGAWIRAAVVVTWQDAAGNVYGTAPVAGTDYEIEYATEGWTNSDGFYYWKSFVPTQETTGVLIKSCSYKANAPDGYSLCVEIIGSGIQVTGTGATSALDAWSKASENGG